MGILAQVTTKSPDYLDVYWTPTSGVDSYNLYVSLVDATGSYHVLLSKINNTPESTKPQYVNRIYVRVQLAAVQIALSNSNLTFVDNYVYFFRITTITGGAESTLSSATTKEVHPIGINDQQALDNEVSNAQGYGFSYQLQRWIKESATKFGAENVFENPLHADNLTVDKTYTTVAATNVVATELWYYTGTPTGGRAKLVTYTYGGVALPSKIVWSDSTAP